jgi:hypothetical protein
MLLVLRNEKGQLWFFVPQEWREIVFGEDLDYLESLFQDFLERSKLHSDALFKQLSSLEVGPLTTQEVGMSLNDHPTLQTLLSGFVELRPEKRSRG